MTSKSSTHAQFRPIAPDDREAFLALCRAFYAGDAVLHPIPDRCHVRTFDELMRSRDYIEAFMIELLEAQQTGPIGLFILNRMFQHEAGGVVVWIELIYIDAPYRAHGIGHQIFDFVEARYPDARLRLEVEPGNRRARALYSALGYRELGYLQMYKDPTT